MDHELVSSEALVLAGYVVTVAADAPPGLATVPGTILTISDCIAQVSRQPEFWDWYLTYDEAALAQTEGATDARVVSVAVRHADTRAFMEETGGADQPYFETLRQSFPFADEVLGYEVVGAEASLDFHSWHCHGYADEVSVELGIRVNDLGLLPSYSAAAAVLQWMLDSPSREAPAPVPWVVVALGVPADR